MKMKRTFKKLCVLALCLTMLINVTGCGKSVSNPAGSEDVKDTSLDAQGITLTDQAGRTITLEKPAQTIVSSYYITTYACMALGLTDRLVGVESKADTRNIYQMAAPELLELPSVGTLKEFNIEATAALKPDLVILPKKLIDSAEALTELGIHVLVVYPESQELLEEMITLISTACGVEEKGEQLLTYYKESKEEVAQNISNITEPLPTVYMAGNSSYLTTAPANMYQSTLITLAGGENAASAMDGDYWTEVSYEDILSMNPEVMIIPSSAEYTVDDIKNDAQLQEVLAVVNNAVYQMPIGIEEWDSPIPSGVLGIRWLLSVLHEDQYSFEAMKEDVVSYYETFYGFDLDDSMITK